MFSNRIPEDYDTGRWCLPKALSLRLERTIIKWSQGQIQTYFYEKWKLIKSKIHLVVVFIGKSNRKKGEDQSHENSAPPQRIHFSPSIDFQTTWTKLNCLQSNLLLINVWKIQGVHRGHNELLFSSFSQD